MIAVEIACRVRLPPACTVEPTTSARMLLRMLLTETAAPIDTPTPTPPIVIATEVPPASARIVELSVAIKFMLWLVPLVTVLPPVMSAVV